MRTASIWSFCFGLFCFDSFPSVPYCSNCNPEIFWDKIIVITVFYHTKTFSFISSLRFDCFIFFFPWKELGLELAEYRAKTLRIFSTAMSKLKKSGFVIRRRYRIMTIRGFVNANPDFISSIRSSKSLAAKSLRPFSNILKKKLSTKTMASSTGTMTPSCRNWWSRRALSGSSSSRMPTTPKAKSGAWNVTR